MRKFAYVPALCALVAVASGCSNDKSKSIAAFTPDFGSVGVRFVVPPMPESVNPNLAATGSSFVSETDYSGFVPDADYNAEDMSHVALWGNGFNGHDVTYAATALQPGIYTFAYLEPDSDNAVQGWVDVDPGGTEMIDFLNRWYNNIPQMRESLAFELELAGGTKMRDTSIFQGFAKQLQAFERLESQLAAAIRAERQAQAETTFRYNEFLRNAEILLLPSETEFFHPTTQPAIRDAELATVREGTPLSKIVLLADANASTWKLKRINSVYSELNRCKIVLMEEADRLQRRKRFYTLTDHIYNHDKLFVHNELRLQQTLAAIDQINDQVSELRDRRMALAFVNEIAAPDGNYRTISAEESDLNREKTVLQARMAQINSLFNEADENSAKRVILERNRQDVMRAIEQIDQQLAAVDQARYALRRMNEGTEVIHRQGNWRLMTAAMAPEDVPFTVRRAVEQEALMTVRVEPTDTMFVPSTTRMTAMPPLIFPDYTTYTYHNQNGHVQLVAETSSGWTTFDDLSVTTYTYDGDGTTTTVSDRSFQDQNDREARTVNASSKSNGRSRSNRNHSTTNNTNNSKSKSRKTSFNDDSRTSNRDNDDTDCQICPLFKIFVPPCWGK